MAVTAFSRSVLLHVQRLSKPLLAGGMAIALSLGALPAWGDPFRPNNPRSVGDQTEAAFRAMFEQGNYVEAGRLLQSAEADEPMAHAMVASLAYLDEDWDTMGRRATRTREAAEALLESDPLRGHLYIAVGHFMEGAHALMTQGTLRGSPTALMKLQQVFSHIGQAEAIDATDPELNLVKGFMDLMIAVNLPLVDPAEAISRLETYAAPPYVAQRGIAVACRDLDDYDCAMAAVERAIAAAPDNPDLQYLKAQILVQQGNEAESLAFFDIALESRANFPTALGNQIAWERCRTNNRVNNETQNCDRIRRRS
jgi:tetratricopeptide (TPR) repeat protein